MQSNAGSVDEYIAEAPPERRAALERLRDLCRACLPGYEEVMEYGMPCYRHDGVDGAEGVAFASQKHYISLYIVKQDVLNAHRAELAGISVGKGCIRYSKPARIDFDLVRRMLEESYASSGPGC